MDLFSGNRYWASKNYDFNNPEKKLKLLKNNEWVTNQKVSNIESKWILITNEVLKSLGFKENEKSILWLVLDSIEIQTTK